VLALELRQELLGLEDQAQDLGLPLHGGKVAGTSWSSAARRCALLAVQRRAIAASASATNMRSRCAGR
jgi:hypothetical protein